MPVHLNQHDKYAEPVVITSQSASLALVKVTDELNPLYPNNSAPDATTASVTVPSSVRVLAL
uniref:Uncharacterized protein n=1 Tax=uncultured marine virus TaxID=186617 RepID=A0A0F7L6S7_9VIRU|nr:hypothetical protein [uncultured marine virus]